MPSIRESSDRNLLFGILALQADLVSRDALIFAMSSWAVDKNKSLGQILMEHGALDSDGHALVEALVGKSLQRHGGNAEKSLAALSSIGSAREELSRIQDADVQASLMHVSTAQADSDPDATRDLSVGTPTSSGVRFRILRPHAKGGLGQVYVAVDEELRREVALKEIQSQHADRPESRARFLLEAKVTGKLEHPSIVPVYGLGQYSDGRPFYAMRFIRGDTLREGIKRLHETLDPDPGEPSANGSDEPSWEEVLRSVISPSLTIGSAVAQMLRTPRVSDRYAALRRLLGRFIAACNAVAYAHSRGVVHRDLKPANIMLGKYGETLVVDWGLAKLVGRPEEAVHTDEDTLTVPTDIAYTATQTGQTVGTPAYMSPEQAAGRLSEVGPDSDVYSLGATLYCILTGQPPFKDADPGVLLQRVQKGDFPRPRQIKRDIPAPLEAICLTAMALRPKERYPSPRALSDDIEHWLADEPVIAYPEPLSVKAGRWLRRHRNLVTTAAMLMVCAVVLLAGAMVQLNRERILAENHAKESLREKVRYEKAGKEIARLSQDLRKAEAKNEIIRREKEKSPEIKKIEAEIATAAGPGGAGLSAPNMLGD
jgi:serine/threonine-protein kinase